MASAPLTLSDAILCTTSFHFSLIWAILLASANDVMFSSWMSFFIQSNHLFTGLPLCLSPCTMPLSNIYGSLWGFILITSPKYRSRLWEILSMMSYFKPSVSLMMVFLILSNRLTSIIFLRHTISKTNSLFWSSFFIVQVSDPYISMERMTVWYSWIVVAILISLMPKYLWGFEILQVLCLFYV